jgi:hypothetical protein
LGDALQTPWKNPGTVDVADDHAVPLNRRMAPPTAWTSFAEVPHTAFDVVELPTLSIRDQEEPSYRTTTP